MNLHDIIGNQVFAGVAGAAIVSAGLYQLRQLPGLAWAVLRDQFSASITVYSEQECFRQIDLWLGRHPSARLSRRLALAEIWNQGLSRSEFELTPGPGPHLLWDERRPIFVNRAVEVPQGGGGASGPRRQTVTLTTIGRTRRKLERLIEEARTVQDRDVVPIHVWNAHGYELVDRRERRALESIFLAGHLRDAIVEDAQRFVERRAWYAERGLPYRRGYMFEGPPGTGKSSMALALAGALHKPIYIINPSALAGDSVLQAAMNQAGAGVVLIEDIDAADCGLARSPAAAADPAGIASGGGMGVSMSGLLNAIDGVAARDGRILIITSNHPEKLDPALIRPGRIDMRCHFGLAGADEAVAMFRRFCPDEDASAFAEEIGAELPLSQAELQNRLLRRAA